jgi:serine/threonine protein kinase
MQDFEPYFCTFEDCTAPFDVPNSFDGLLAHMQSHLPARHHVDNSTVGHKELTEEDFEDHVRSYGVVTKENMISMKEASRRKGAFLFETCPFCGGYPDVLEKIFPDRDSFDAQRGLRGHIKQHMQEIALFLPPYRSDIFDEDDNCEGSDVTHRRSNIDEADYNPDQFLDICDREDCDCKQRSEKVNEDSDIARAYEKGVLAVEAKKVDWANVLEGFSGYDRAKVSDGDLLTDDRLCPFIMRFALQEPHDDIGSETWGTVDQRVNDMLRLLRASFRERITMGPSQLDDVTAIHFLLVNHKSQFLEDELALWQNSKNGNLAAVRRLLEGFDIPQSTADVHSDTNVKIAPLQASETVEIQENEESKGKDVYELNINELQGLGGSKDWRGPDRAGRSEAFYKNVTVWIEWKQEALAPWMNGSLDPRIHKHIRDLVVTLQEFRVSFKGQAVVIPRYIGYFQDVEERQFGLVLEKPLSPVPMEEIASLHELLVSTDTNKPDMDKRIHLIRNLQSAIKYIHAEGQVHRGLRSQNILLFRSERSTSIDLTRSYLAGFDVLYPELSDDCTELPMDDPCVNIYRHPRSQAGGNRDTHGEQFTLNKSYDLYSLGLVLLEIAHWNTIDRIMEIDLERGRPKDTWRVRERLLTGDKTSALAWVANVFHVDAAHMIRACLEGEDIVWGKNTTSAPQMPDIPYIPPPIPEMPRSPSLASALSSDPSHDDPINSMESEEPVAHWAMNIFDGRHTSSPYHSFSQSTTQPIPSSQTPPVSTNSQSVSKSPLPSETPPSPSLGAANPVSETTSAQESSSSVVHPSDIHNNSSICLGRDEPRLIELLQNDGFEKVVEIPFEATNVWVRLYWRANDNRARIVFLTKDSAGRRMRYCVPLTGLKVMRDKSCLQLCRVNRKDGQLDLWARLRFVIHERKFFKVADIRSDCW